MPYVPMYMWLCFYSGAFSLGAEEFHHAAGDGTGDACPNREIIKALDRTHLLFVPSLYLLNPSLNVPQGAMDEALDEHLDIIDQVLDRNHRGAATALRLHLNEAASRWLRRFEIFEKADRSPLPRYLVSLGSDQI